MKGFGMPKPLKSIEKQTLFLILGHSKKTMKNRCQNGTQKIIKWTKNATKSMKRWRGGEERGGKGKERRGKKRTAEVRGGKEKKGSQRGEATVRQPDSVNWGEV